MAAFPRSGDTGRRRRVTDLLRENVGRVGTPLWYPEALSPEFKLDMSEDGSTWQNLIEGRYERADRPARRAP